MFWEMSPEHKFFGVGCCCVCTIVQLAICLGSAPPMNTCDVPVTGRAPPLNTLRTIFLNLFHQKPKKRATHVLQSMGGTTPLAGYIQPRPMLICADNPMINWMLHDGSPRYVPSPQRAQEWLACCTGEQMAALDHYCAASLLTHSLTPENAWVSIWQWGRKSDCTR